MSLGLTSVPRRTSAVLKLTAFTGAVWGGGYRMGMPVSDSPRIAKTHLEAEVRKIVRTLQSYGPLHERALRQLVRGSRWRDGCLRDALDSACAQGRVRPLGLGFYEVPSSTAGNDGPPSPDSSSSEKPEAA